MKKINVLILILAMLTLGACSGNAAEPSKAQPAEDAAEAEIEVEAEVEAEEESKEIKTEPAEAVALYDYALIEKYDRGTEIEVLCDVPGLDSYSIVRAGDNLGIMAKYFFHVEGTPEYASWIAHSKNGAVFCTGYDMDEDTAEPLEPWTSLKVLGEADYCYVVEMPDGRVGTAANDEVELYGKGGKSWQKYGDGDDIIISADSGEAYAACTLGYEVSESDAYEGKATIICNQAPLLAGLYDYADEVTVTVRDDEVCTLICGGVEGQVEKRFLLFPGETPYQSWDAFVASSTPGFKNIRLIGDPAKSFSVNTVVKVINDFEESYLVEINGELYYMDHENVSDHRFPVIPNPGHGQEWTPPKR